MAQEAEESCLTSPELCQLSEIGLRILLVHHRRALAVMP